MPETLDIRLKRQFSAGMILSELDRENLPQNFPFTVWNEQARRYIQYWDYFDGTVWEEMIEVPPDQDGEPTLKYPLQLNPIKTLAFKQSYVILGEVSDNPGPMIPCRIEPRTFNVSIDDEQETDEALKKQAMQIEEFVNRVWIENNGRALQTENVLVQQPMGGCWFRMIETDDPEIPTGIRIENVIPDFVFATHDSGRPDNLLEVFMCYRVPAREAQLKYGYVSDNNSGLNQPLYVEHWTKKAVSIYMNGEILDWEGVHWDEVEHDWGRIPFFYIPRERAGGFYGYSIVDDLKGLAREINARLADMGDVIAENAHRVWFVRNVGPTVRTRNVGGKTMIDLGTQAPGVSNLPEAFMQDPPDIPTTLGDYPEVLHEQFGRDGFLPAVAEGKDEGSQRSALTLAFRMWPLTSKARAIRTYWTNALNRMNRTIAEMGIKRKQLKVPVTVLDEVQWLCEWSPMIPRDREQLVNEAVLAVSTGFMAPLTAIRILGQVTDPIAEYEAIREHKEWESELQAQNAMQDNLAKPTTPKATSGVDESQN